MKPLMILLLLMVAMTSSEAQYPYEQTPPIYYRPFQPSYFDVRPYQQQQETYYKAPLVTAVVDLEEGVKGSGVRGTLYLKQKHPGAPVLISGQIFGLSEGLHGFHVHMEGKLTAECKDAGAHFNPFMKSHGDPHSLDRHAGDLGNIMTFSADLPTEVLIMDKLITLENNKENGVLNRSFVVHAKQDDLGSGGDEESLKTGNAGARLACGVIREVTYQQPY